MQPAPTSQISSQSLPPPPNASRPATVAATGVSGGGSGFGSYTPAAAPAAQARVTGARITPVDGRFEDALRACLEIADSGSHVLVNSLNPDRLAGQRTAAFEICEQLGRAPDVLAVPYGGGGNTVAYVSGFEAVGGAPHVVAAESADREHTIASAIRIAQPVHRA